MNKHAGKSSVKASNAVANISTEEKNSNNAASSFTGKTSSYNVDDSVQMKRQRNYQSMANEGKKVAQQKANATGLPDSLKSGIETLSNFSMDDVRVYYNSSKPVQFHALAYTQGTDIHIGKGQEKYLPHEAWHVVQQKQGRVQPTLQLKGAGINDNHGLEQEADIMGAKALLAGKDNSDSNIPAMTGTTGSTIQRAVGFEFETTWDLIKPADIPWNTDTVLVKGMNWELSPDEIGDVPNQGKIEFKTSPIDVDAGDDIEAVYASADPIFNSLASYTNSLLDLDDGGNLPTMIGAYRNRIRVNKRAALTAKPQVTGGVRPDLLIRLLHDTTRAATRDHLLQNADAQGYVHGRVAHARGQMDMDSRGSREYWGTVALLASYVRIPHELFQTARAEIRELRRGFREREAVVLDNDALSAEEKEAQQQALLVEYNVQAEAIKQQGRPKYAKAIAFILPRVRFRRLAGITTETLLADILATVGMDGVDGGSRLFPLGLRVNPDDDQTIAQWVAHIQAQAADGPLDQADFWSSREFESAEVGRGDQRGPAVLFELRGMQSGLDHTGWREFARWYLNYFRMLNETEKAPNP